jgi:dolichyl-phosphate-mannose-protein mannosyltransferase
LNREPSPPSASTRVPAAIGWGLFVRRFVLPSFRRLDRCALWLRGAARGVRTDAALSLVLAAMLLVGVLLRVHHLGVPTALKWDENHYVETARSYVARQYAWNDHPPLGKLIIAGMMATLGDSPVAWRLAPLLFGLSNIALIAWLTLTTFKSTRAAWIAAAFVAADGFFIAYSRSALLDGMIVAFGVAATTIILRGRRIWHVLAAGVLVGCATSCKLNGLAFVATATAVCLASRKLRRYTPVLLGTALLVFYAQCAYALKLTGRSGSVAAVIAENREMVRHHLSYTVVHPFSSHWYTWFLPVRPFFLRRDVDFDGSIRALITLGNPLLWWSSTVAVIVASVVVIRTGPRRLWLEIRGERTPGETPATGQSAALFWLLAAWAAPVIFWIPSLRDSYLYHYLPSYAFALVLLAGFTDRVYRRHRLVALIAVVVIAEITIFYAPLWGELPIARDALNVRLFFKFWR